MARGDPDRLYGRGPRPMLDSLPLALAFLAGTVGGIALKLAQAPALLTAGFAAAVLVAYALFSYAATRLRLDTETIGDNCYYLGFLFTLTSLAVTLYFVVEAAPETRADLIPQVISGFGVALSSTIVGVFLRVLMMQLRVDLDLRERRTRIELDEAARRFRSELGVSLGRVKNFSTESLQHASEREDRMREAMDRLMAQMQAELLKSAADFGPALRDTMRAQTDQVMADVTEAVRESSTAACEAIRQAMTELAQVAQTFSRDQAGAAQAVAQSVDSLKASAEALALGTEQSLARLNAAATGGADWAESLGARIEAETEALGAALSNAARRLDQVAPQGSSDA